MSRIGKKPIFIPKNVYIKIINDEIIVKGTLGILNQKFKNINLKITDDHLFIRRKENSKISKSLHGLYRVLINNMIIGVSIGFEKKLELIGIGYKAVFIDKYILSLSLGFSHDIFIQVPKEIIIKIQSTKGNNTIIILSSYNKQLLGIFSAKIRSFRKPEPYKGKGVRYFGEEVRRKTGKSV